MPNRGGRACAHILWRHGVVPGGAGAAQLGVGGGGHLPGAQGLPRGHREAWHRRERPHLELAPPGSLALHRIRGSDAPRPRALRRVRRVQWRPLRHGVPHRPGPGAHWRCGHDIGPGGHVGVGTLQLPLPEPRLGGPFILAAHCNPRATPLGNLCSGDRRHLQIVLQVLTRPARRGPPPLSADARRCAAQFLLGHGDAGAGRLPVFSAKTGYRRVGLCRRDSARISLVRVE
mmetsp:Transcript_10550/g.31825  ORF Transcript_10550/g.31825 Transcript_10550/m.31825 type:complete len:231 (-) Transcript_10550:1198-1890(-)